MAFLVSCILALISTDLNIIDRSIDNFNNNIRSYSVTIRSINYDNNEVIKYYYKKPGHVKIESITPYKGVTLVYDPLENIVRVQPFRFLSFFVITLSPWNSLIKSSKGHQIDKSDFGALLLTVKHLLNRGDSSILREESFGNRQTVVVRVQGSKDITVKGINMYHIWMDKEYLLPLKVLSFDKHGKLAEEVLMEDLQINLEFSRDFFKL